MFKNIFSLLVLLLLLNINGFSQVRKIDDPDYNYSAFWDFYSENNIGARVWGMGGAGVANVEDLSSMVVNPAALMVRKRISFYGEILTKNKNPWLKEVSDMYLESPVVLPDFIGIGIKVSETFNTGLGFLAPKTFNLDLGEVGISIPDKPIPDEYIEAYTHFRARQIFLPISMKVGKRVCLGANLNYNFISVKHQLIYKGESEKDYWNLKLGTLIQPSNKFNLGLTFVPQRSFSTETEWKGEDTSFVEKFEKTTLPWELGIGFYFHNLGYPLNFAFDVKFSRNSKIDNQVDRYDYHLGVEIEISEEINILFGYFSRLDYRNPKEGWLLGVGELDQHFLTLGVSFELERFLLQASLRNSDLLSRGLMEQTNFSLGSGFYF